MNRLLSDTELLQARCHEYETLIRRLVEVCDTLPIHFDRQELKISRCKHKPVRSTDASLTFREELESERSYSSRLRRENEELRQKLSKSMELLKSGLFAGTDIQTSAERAELASLRQEVTHLRDLLRLGTESFDQQTMNSSDGSKCGLFPETAPSNPATPPRSPRMGRADESRSTTSREHQVASVQTDQLLLEGNMDYASDITDVGPPMSPNGQTAPRREMSPDESEADRIDSEEIRVSYREVDNDLGDQEVSLS